MAHLPKEATVNAAHAQMYDFDTPAAGPLPRSSNDRVVDERAESWERTYATLLHASVLLSFVLFPVIPTLIMWLIKRGDSPLVDDHGREQLNMQIGAILMTLICGVLTPFTLGLSAAFLVVYYIILAIGVFKAMFAASNSEYYRYPMTIRVIS